MAPVSTELYPSASLAMAHERIAQLRREAEEVRLARAARPRPATRRGPAWPVAVMVALRDSLASAARGTARRGEPCPTC